MVDFSRIGNASNVGKCKNISNISDAGIFFNIDIVRITGNFSNISIISNAGEVIFTSNNDNFNNIGSSAIRVTLVILAISVMRVL